MWKTKMEKREIAVVVSNKNQDVGILETINAIYDAGFRNVFIQWYNRDWNPDQEKQENNYNGAITMEFCYQYEYTSIGIMKF